MNFWVMWIMSITKQVFNFSTLYIVAFNQYWHWSCEILLMHVHGLYKSVHTVHVGGDFNRKLLGLVEATCTAEMPSLNSTITLT